MTRLDAGIAGMTCRELRHAIDRFHELAPEEWRCTAARSTSRQTSAASGTSSR